VRPLSMSTFPASQNRSQQCHPIGQTANDNVLVRSMRTIADSAHPIESRRTECGREIAVAAAAGRAFFARAARLVGEVGDHLASVDRPGDVIAGQRRLARQREQMRLSRRVIENQLAAVAASTGGQKERLKTLQLDFYQAEQGLSQLVEAVWEPADVASLPTDIATSFSAVLGTLGAALRDAADPSTMQQLAAEATELRAKVREAAGASARTEGELPAWSSVAFGLARGSRSIARSLASARTIVSEVARGEARDDEAPGHLQRAASVQVLGRYSLHPTTILSVQVVIAVVVATGVGRLLDLNHTNWIFWTAFVVIAGSAGESLRRVVLRVLGTVAGTLVGVAVALALPDEQAVVILVATVGVFFSIYFAAVSYPLMVLWLSVAFVMVFAQVGARELDLLRERPLATAIGAIIAGIVTLTVLPIRATNRLHMALRVYLEAVRAATAAWGAAVVDPRERLVAAAATERVVAAFAAVERALPAVVFESNPLVGHGPRSGQAVQIDQVGEAFRRLAYVAAEDSDASQDVARSDRPLLAAVQERIDQNLAALCAFFGGADAQLTASLMDLAGSAEGLPGVDAVSAGSVDLLAADDDADAHAPAHAAGHDLLRAFADLHRSVIQLAVALGVPTVEPQASEARPGEQR